MIWKMTKCVPTAGTNHAPARQRMIWRKKSLAVWKNRSMEMKDKKPSRLSGLFLTMQESGSILE